MDKTICAIIGITVIECFALLKGVNGTLLAGAIGAIAALGGYYLPKLLEKVKSSTLTS